MRASDFYKKKQLDKGKDTEENNNKVDDGYELLDSGDLRQLLAVENSMNLVNCKSNFFLYTTNY